MKVIPRYRKRVYPVSGETVYYLERVVPMPFGIQPIVVAHSTVIPNNKLERGAFSRKAVAHRLMRTRREIRSIDITRKGI